MRKAEKTRRTVNLALQGGGTHGAFGWGVLDRFLEDGRIAIEGISGTSAGAMNGAILIEACHKGGPAAARRALSDFWHRMSELSDLNPIRRSWYEMLTGQWNLDRSPAALAVEMANLFLSPYQTNPGNHTRMQVLLEEFIDIDALRAADPFKLFVAATNVRSGLPRVFTGKELSIEALMASSCIPTTYQAVEIDGEAYWDGGYSGNPALWPLIYDCDSPDIIVVQVGSLRRDRVPHTAPDIVSRLGEITFNASYLWQLRSIALVTQLIAEPGAMGPQIDRLKKRNFFLHRIEAEKEMQDLGVVSQANTELEFLYHLRDLGRKAAAHWLDENLDAINQRSTFDPIKFFGM